MNNRTLNILVTHISLLLTLTWAYLIYRWSSLPAYRSPLRADLSPTYYDQLAHFCVYYLLASLVWCSLTRLSGKPFYSATFSITFTYGFLDELHQLLAGHGRTFSPSDLAFDFLGILAAMAVLAIISTAYDLYRKGQQSA
jgi:VanZ family protein